jgi:phosphoglycolate phosphatase
MSAHLPSALLLDLDGVLIESQQAWFLTMNAVARRLRFPAIDRVQFAATWGQSVAADACRFYPGIDPDTIAANYVDTFGDFLAEVQINPDAAGLFTACKQTRRRTAVVTNTPQALARMLLDHSRLTPDALYTPSAKLQPKPAPDLLFAASAGLGVRPDEVLFVGDTSNDLLAAQAAKVSFIGYNCAAPRTATSLADIARWLAGPLSSSPPG